MKLSLFLSAVLLVCGPAIAAGKPGAKPCPKGEVATHLDTWNGKPVCAKPQAVMTAPVKAAKGGPVTAPVLTKTN